MEFEEPEAEDDEVVCDPEEEDCPEVEPVKPPPVIVPDEELDWSNPDLEFENTTEINLKRSSIFS